MGRNYFGVDVLGLDDFGDDDAANQLAQVFGLDPAPRQQQRGWHVEGNLQALMADALAADMMFGADSPQAIATKGAVVNAMRQRGPSPQMQMLQKAALAHSAGKGTFTSTGEANTSIKAEMLPIPRTVVPLNSQTTIAVRPIRSMQINTVRFPSDRAATAACRVEDISILGTSQLNGPGGIACSGLTEVRTAPILKGSTAQAGQDILVTISNTTGVNQTIEGWFEGPDLVRVT
jgi:hypothetical protein